MVGLERVWVGVRLRHNVGIATYVARRATVRCIDTPSLDQNTYRRASIDDYATLKYNLSRRAWYHQILHIRVVGEE